MPIGQKAPIQWREAFVTNKYLSSELVWHLYNKRADCENRIRELRNDYGMEGMSLKLDGFSPPFQMPNALFGIIQNAQKILIIMNDAPYGSEKSGGSNCSRFVNRVIITRTVDLESFHGI